MTKTMRERPPNKRASLQTFITVPNILLLHSAETLQAASSVRRSPVTYIQSECEVWGVNLFQTPSA